MDEMISKDKIKVFISSKCGGERINFDKFAITSSESKKEIADKFVRTSYDLVRRALKTSLEETGFIETYLFEDGSASTLTAKENYFYELDTSDVCLFLIDNFDEEITEGLLSEITRAQKINKKSIYLFLNHPDYEKTAIQQSLKGANSAQYVEIDDIREFIDVGYKSVINDILRIYHVYGRGNSYDIEKATPTVEITKESFPIEFTDIDKQIFENLGQTKNKIIGLVYEPATGDNKSSDVDKLCLTVLEFLLGEKKFSDIDLASLLETLKGIQTPELHKMVSQRWDAISSFYNGELTNAINNIETIYNKYSNDVTISKWLLNDVLIDWRVV